MVLAYRPSDNFGGVVEVPFRPQQAEPRRRRSIPQAVLNPLFLPARYCGQYFGPGKSGISNVEN
jgi:hypothetical protein